ncbi:hypothetical protein [Novosphingobium aquimarinum]|uniref:hypothetical protein n=1 Tax=Novosphingobium aquimarinum TaxID=2682494 RepID=UPI0012EB1AAC|nr:hypothetical protein [Novosphingobium aquimarinum]
MEPTFYLLAVPGAFFAILALTAWLGDRRRVRRRDLERIGFMPWTGLFFLSLVAALILLGLAGREWIAAGL